jgi:hypothetical protein
MKKKDYVKRKKTKCYLFCKVLKTRYKRKCSEIYARYYKMFTLTQYASRTAVTKNTHKSFLTKILESIYLQISEVRFQITPRFTAPPPPLRRL